jgi:hypothetical protein
MPVKLSRLTELNLEADPPACWGNTAGTSTVEIEMRLVGDQTGSSLRVSGPRLSWKQGERGLQGYKCATRVRIEMTFEICVMVVSSMVEIWPRNAAEGCKHLKKVGNFNLTRVAATRLSLIIH